MMNKLYCYFLAGRMFIFTPPSQTLPFHLFIFTPPSQTLPFHLGKKFSTLADSNIESGNGHLQNPFAEFATKEFNFSSDEILSMFKLYPSLERLQTLDKVEQFVEMLKKHGCNQHQIARIMRMRPGMLTASAETSEAKILLLKDFGIQGEHLAKVLTNKPCIFDSSLQRELLPKMTFLRNIFQSHDLLVKAIVRNSSILVYSLEKTLKPSLAFWERCGLAGKELVKFLLGNPSLLRHSSLTPAKVDLIQKIGIDRRSIMFKYVLRVVVPSRIETLEAKMHNLQQYGFSPEQILELFRLYPAVFNLSENNVREKIDFFVNRLEFSANIVLKHPSLLMISLEKVAKPRFLVVQSMESMDGVSHRKDMPLSTILFMTAERFVRKIIKGHPESVKLHAIYQNAVANVSSRTGISRKTF